MDNSARDTQADIFNHLRLLYQRSGSDMFFSVGAPPHIKIEGSSRQISEIKLQSDEVQRMAYQLMTEKQISEFETNLEMNFAIGLKDCGRYRINVYYQRGEVAMVVRLIKDKVPSFKELNLPDWLGKLALQERGLILVVGAAGSGKSTTLAALLDYRNRNMGGHIVCIEDPIEFLHEHHKSIIDQREIGLDTHSFADALRNVLRESPDVIMLGEIRDYDTMQNALHYAETGHLVAATLHSTSTNHAIERIVRFYPDEARKQILADLSQNLLATIGQRLVPALTQKRIAALEIMLGTSFIKDLIQRDQISDLKEAISRSNEQGMQTFDQHLYALHEAGIISHDTALKFADSHTDLSLKIKLEHGKSIDNPDLKMSQD